MEFLVGDPERFAIRSVITAFVQSEGMQAIGAFNIFVKGTKYGVDHPEATCLGCSHDSVLERIAGRGRHIAPFSEFPSGAAIVRACYRAGYQENDDTWNFDWSYEDVGKLIWARGNDLFLAPDGDEAFDDSSYIVHFDIGNRSRVVGCTIGEDAEPIPSTIQDIELSSDEFYGLLERWSSNFHNACEQAKASKDTVWYGSELA